MATCPGCRCPTWDPRGACRECMYSDEGAHQPNACTICGHDLCECREMPRTEVSWPGAGNPPQEV
jgi:hypothetical protein